MAELLLGDEAIAFGAIDAGIRGSFSYPGTPATEILECVQAATRGNDNVVALWSANEKVAYEEALGMSYVGQRALVSMKHVGLNVAADPFVNSAITGANGGLVCIVADDPSMHSSQNEQDTRYYAEFAKVVLLEPSNQQEAYDMTRDAFVLSEKFGLPVMVRITTRLAHSRANVVRRPADEIDYSKRQRGEPRDWTLLPVNARRRFKQLLELQPTLLEYTQDSPYNKLELKGSKGIIASGIAYNYVREAFEGDCPHSMLKIGAYPIPTGLVRELVNHCEEIYLVEEGYPYIETRLQGILGVQGRQIKGRTTGAFPIDGEMSTDLVRKAFSMPTLDTPAVVQGLPNRPPALCEGCPHSETFTSMLDASAGMEPVLFSDIGCYTLGALPPYNAVQSCVDMGASISMALGAAKAGVHPVICTIGDSTFTHSGMTPLLGAAHLDANMTVIILDNSTVGMTGGQEVFITGDEFLDLLKGLGVKEEHLIKIDPVKKAHEENVEIFKRELQHKGLSVILACRACIQAVRKMAKEAAAKAKLEQAAPA
jgi:indolepyruvate ferredoxin oxidoreductase alpha subunit